MRLGSFFGFGSGGKKPTRPTELPKGPVKLRGILQPTGHPVIPLKKPEDRVPDFMLRTAPRRPNCPPLPLAAETANKTGDILATTHITLEDLAGIEVGDTLVYGSGTRREITEIGGDGAITVKTTKIWPADKLNHQFCSEPGLDGFCSHDYLSLKAKVVLYPTFKVAEGNGNQFTIVEVQKTGNIVTGVVFSFSQVFPEGFAADVKNIVRIKKIGQ